MREMWKEPFEGRGDEEGRRSEKEGRRRSEERVEVRIADKRELERATKLVEKKGESDCDLSIISFFLDFRRQTTTKLNHAKRKLWVSVDGTERCLG